MACKICTTYEPHVTRHSSTMLTTVTSVITTWPQAPTTNTHTPHTRLRQRLRQRLQHHPYQPRDRRNETGRRWWTRKGPNDIWRVVWAPGEFFFFHYSCLFSLLNYIYRYYVCYRDTEHLLGGYDEGNGPKRHVLRRLGTRWISFLLIGGFFLLTMFKGPYSYFRSWDGLMGCYDEGNGPKRRKTCRLGTRWVFLFIIRVSFLY